MCYTQPSYWTSIVGKNCAYYIRIFTVILCKRAYSCQRRLCHAGIGEFRECLQSRMILTDIKHDLFEWRILLQLYVFMNHVMSRLQRIFNIHVIYMNQ